MRTRQIAAKLRVAHLEAASSGGLNVHRLAAALRDLRRRSDEVALSAAWGDWLDRLFLLQLDDAVQEARARGVTPHRIETHLVGEAAQRPLTPQQAGLVKRRSLATAAR